MTLNLIVSNKPSIINQKLLKFFELNITNLNKASLIFEFDVITPDNMDEYAAKGIDTYPVLIHGNEKNIGVEKIIAYLKFLINKFNSNIKSRTESDKLNDYWLDNIKMAKDNLGNNKADDDENNELNPSGDIQKKILAAFEQRNDTPSVGSLSKQKLNKAPIKQGNSNSNFNKPNNSTNSVNSTNSTNSSKSKYGNSGSSLPKPYKNVSEKGGDMDDILMKKFFENQGCE